MEYIVVFSYITHYLISENIVPEFYLPVDVAALDEIEPHAAHHLK